MCSDTQTTEAVNWELQIKWEYSVKIKQVDKFSLMGCAGTVSYIELFANHMQKAVSDRRASDYYETINLAIESYSSHVRARAEKIGVSPDDPRYYPEGVFATYDAPSANYRLFQIQTPDPCVEPAYPFRVSAGSGSIPATALLKNVEYLMMKVGLNWNLLTTNLVAQFCFLLLRRVEHIDPGTSGLHIWRIDRNGAHWLDGDDIWGGQKENYRLTSFLRTAMSEIPKEKLQRLIEQYKLLDVFRKLMPLEI